MKPLFSPRCLRVTGVLAVIFCLGALACRALSPGTAGCRQEDLSHWPAALNAEADAGASSPPTEKRVFLTFDDGPSATTETILDTLAEKQVKASFLSSPPKTTKNTCPWSSASRRRATPSPCTAPATITATSTPAPPPTGRTSTCCWKSSPPTSPPSPAGCGFPGAAPTRSAANTAAAA